MSTYRKVDSSTLGWVKSEIDETLKQARLALEGFVENPSDRGRLRFCITHLHQVVGTLLMVELDGAAMMAREIEALAEAVFEDKGTPSQESLEVLTRAILLLPDYLARLQYGHPDQPLRHLALLNELRAARKAEAIAELDLFNPDLSVRPPAGAGERERLADAEYSAFARQQRASYQGALLNWLRDTSDKTHLHTIAEVLRQLQARASVGALEQLFWVAGGLLEGMIEGVLDATPERKKHLARVDQQIKKIVDGTEKSVLRSSSEAVVRALLYDLALATTTTSKIAQLKQVFALDELIGQAALPTAVDEESLPPPEVLKSVAGVLAKEIEQAQDMLAAAFDSRKTDARSLAPLLELLHKMAGTVDMAGLPLLKNLLDEILATATALGEGRIRSPESASMPLAQALLMVEGGTRDIPRSAGEWKQQIDQCIQVMSALYTEGEAPSAHGIEVTDAALTETEYQQLLGVVATEVGVNLGRIEEALEGFAGHTAQLERLDDIPKQLGQIQGAMQILGAERAVDLAATTRRYIEEVQHSRIAVDATLLDGLAVCVGTLGAYVDGLKAGRKNLDSLIDSALREIEAAVKDKLSAAPAAQDPIRLLRERFDEWFGEPTNAAACSAVREQLAAVAALPSRAPDKTEMIATETGRLIDLVADDAASLSQEVEMTLRASCDALAGFLSNAAPAASTAIPSSTTAKPHAAPTAAPAATTIAGSGLPENFDQEILEIFIEDARDVLGNITREYATWQVAPDDVAALAELRRGYHTLKGSGRMVGAALIADLAWAIENMLNHVRDGKMKPTPEVVEIVGQSQAALPDMIAQLEGGVGTTIDTVALAAQAHDVVARRGESASGASVPSASGMPLPKLDGTLLEIFTNEARGHLASIRTQIANCRETGSACLVTPTLTRSIHTLQGNARSLGIRMMAEACAEAERLLHALQLQHLPMVVEHLDLLEQFVAIVSDLVEAVASGANAAEGMAERFAATTRGLHAECEKFAPPEPAHVPHTTPAPIITAPEEDAPLIDEAPQPIAPAPPMAPSAQPQAIEAADASADDLTIDRELLEIFQEEATDILDHVEQTLRAWRAEPDNMGVVLELKRDLHTLKGGARMAGAMTMGNLSHHTESLLMQIENRAVASSAALFDLLEETHDALVAMLNRIARGQPVQNVDSLMARLIAAVSGQTVPASLAMPNSTAAAPAASADAAEPPPPVAQSPAPTAPPAPPASKVAEPRSSDASPAESSTRTEESASVRTSADEQVAASGAAEARPAVGEASRAAAETEGWVDRRERPGQIRVNTDLLNSLVNYAGEVSISRARMEQQIYGFRDNLAELRRNAVRFREQLRELEIQSESQILYRLDHNDAGASDFDPLEFDRFSRLQQLTRSLTESLHDLTTIQLNMGNFVGEAEAVLQQQARLNTDLQEGLMRTRMVEFSTQAARLRHIARQTARELGKRAELEFTGGDVQIDRTVLERMTGPLEHMIRNSLDHGIESESERVRLGKPPVGRITVAAKQEGNEIVINFSDDGAGMNVERIRAKAIERGLLAADATISEDDVLQFVLLSGFSTASQITHVSGRGVGMDVVHSEVKQLGGSMAVDTKQGVGTTFIIRLPLTLSITQALMVYVGDQTFAVPLGSVSNIIESSSDQVGRLSVGKNPLLNHNDKLYSFMSLGARLGIPSSGRKGRKVPVLLARAGTREVAIQVDGLGGTREIVVKALGPQLSEIKGISGATIMGDGRVVLILDVPGLWYAEEALHVEHHERPAPAAETRTRPVVMVVDDSLTVRKVTGKHLQKRGFEVMVAKDGVDAVEQLRARVPDLMLVDIEMPRMDGYELTGRVRAESGLKHIPIIMITSRAGDKHRQRAFELGVDVYMSKPYQEDELFRNVDTLLARGRAR